MSSSDFSKGNKLLRSHKLEEAVAAYQRAIALNPSYHWSYHRLGQALEKLGRLKEAVTAHRQAVALNQNAGWLHFSLGRVLAKQQQWEDAVSSYQKAVELQLHKPQVFYELGRALANLNRWDEAVNAYNRSVELNPYSANFHYSLAQALKKQGKHQEAVAESQKAFYFGCDRQDVRERSEYALTKKFQNNYLLDFNPNQKAYVEIPHSESLTITEDITIEFWLYLREWSATWTGIVTKYINDRNNEFCLRTKNQHVGQWYYGDGNKYMVVGWIPKDEIELNEWTHVACVRKIGEYGKVFVNGVPWYHQDWTDRPKAVKTKSSVVLMGTPSLQSFQNGKMCDLRIWNIARTQDEILADLDKELTGSEPGLVWHWKFDESLKTFANDENSKGKIFNATLVKTEKSGDGYQIEKAIKACRSTSASQRIYDDIWLSLNQPVVNLDTNNDWPQTIELRRAEKYFNANTKFSLIDIESIESLETLQCLEKLGIEDIPQFCKNLKKITSYQDNKNHDIYEFKLNAVKNGYLESICPWSGEILKSCQSFIVSADSSMSAFAYRFASKQTFYLFLTGGHDWKFSIYFPSTELIVVIRIREESIAAKLCLQLKSYVVVNWLDFENYVSDDNKYKDLVAITGIGVHLGHTTFNEYPSYYQLFENNLLKNFKKILIGPFEYIPFDRLFSEIDREKIVRKPDYSSLEMFTFCMKSNYFLLRPSNCEYNLNAKIATRIYDASVSSCSHTCLQDIEAAKKNFPLLWFEVKSNRRIWLNQAEAIAEIANRLHSDYPKLGIIFAGWSAGSQDHLRDRQFIEKDKQVIQQSKLLLNPEIPTFAVVGYKTYEKIAWAGAASIHIAAYGSGNLFASIAGKKLIVHANKGWYPARSIKASLLANTHLSKEEILVIPIEYIIDEKPEMHHYSRNYYCNWEGIYNAIFEKLISVELEKFSDKEIVEKLIPVGLEKFSELLSALNSKNKVNSLIKNYKKYWQKVPKTEEYKSLNNKIELNLLRLLINKTHSWKDNYFDSESSLFDKGHILVACMPKSGSTVISHLLARLAGAKLYPLVDAYDTSEQKLYFPQVVNSLTYENLVVHQHVKATQLNIRLIKTFKMIPIVLVRNIFDVVVSLRDHLVNRSLINAQGIYIADNFLKMEYSKQIDFVIDMMVPYYFSFYVSWYYASIEKTVNMLWVKYEDYVNSPVNVALSMSNFCQLDVTEQEIQKTLETIEKDKHKFGYNKGIVGRGSILSKSQKTKIIERKSYYDSNIDFKMIGL